MKRIPDFREFIGEGYLGRVTRAQFGDDERLEDRIVLPEGVERVSFTDRNGKFHKNGYRVMRGYDISPVLNELVETICGKRGWDCDLNDIDVSNITDMENVFEESPFSGDISGWDVSNVKYMKGLFKGSKFDGDISKWDVSNVVDMSDMFKLSDFNGDISKWDTSSVEDMYGMFVGAKSFDQDISKWNVDNVHVFENMFDYCPLSDHMQKQPKFNE